MKILASPKIILYSIIVVLMGCTPKFTEMSQPSPAIEISAFPSTLKIDNTGIEFTGYQRDEQNFIIDICFDPPSEDVWHFVDVILKINDQEFSTSEVIVGSGLGRADGFDCGYIYFPSKSIPHSGKAELSIGRLQNYLNRKSHRIEDCNHAQKKLDAARTGIVITCDPSIVPYYRFFVVTQKPPSMSNEDAELFVWEAFSEFIDIDWRFLFQIDEP